MEYSAGGNTIGEVRRREGRRAEQNCLANAGTKISFPAKKLIFSERKRHFEIEKCKKTKQEMITLNYLEHQLPMMLQNNVMERNNLQNKIKNLNI